MSAARRSGPRAHVHRGTVEGVALWFDPALLGEAEARRRVLAAWAPGVSVYALAGGFLLRLPSPRSMACAGVPGLPFTLEDGVLLSAPLSASERERLAPPPGSAVLVRAGTARVHPLEPSMRVDVSAWLDVSGWDVVHVEGLGAPPPPVAEPTPVAAPTRASFGLGPPAPEAEEMKARMAGRAVPETSTVHAVRRPGFFSRLFTRFRAWWMGGTQRPGSMTVDGSAAPAQGGEIASRPSLLGRMLAAFLSALLPFQGSGTAPSNGSASSAPAPRPRPPSGPGLFSRLTRWLATSTPLGSLLGRRKAEYVRRLFDLFDQGNLDEALRYAIPLNKGGLSERARLSLGLPGPREQLTIQTGPGGGATSVFGGGDEVYAALKERYRQAVRKLEREGRIEEAAFVLAELLHEDEEAVSFLERHGRWRLAAELAEGRHLAPGLVVRQWLLAKDVARAVEIARRRGAFADAVVRLERTHPEQARVLRLLWGEVLAQAGDYARAVDVVWPVEDARRLTRAWLERGLETGGVTGARLLARLVLAFPDSFETARAKALVLLDGEDAEGAAARHTFAELLATEVEQKRGLEEPRALLRPAARAVLRDWVAGHLPLKSRGVEHLVQQVADPVLWADLPPLSRQPEPRGFPLDGTPVSHAFDEAEGGPWPIHDAVPLSGGRVLVALGEAGARLLTLEGRCVAHFDVPAFSLVLSVHEDRALALAPRGTLMRLSRLDLVQRRAEPWCDARVDAFAPVYDGGLWFLAVEDTVMAVDVLASDLRALWRVSRVGGPVVALAVGPSEMSFASAGSEGPERWSYSLPDPTLRSRQVLPLGEDALVRWLSLGMDGAMVVLTDAGARWFSAYGRANPVPTLPEMELEALFLGGSWVAALERTPVGIGVRLLERARGGVRALFLFEGATPVSVRFLQDALLLFDTSGRLVRVDLARGVVRRMVPR
ncbi:bpX6 domain-containing protein [Archangium lipolyticum]|uniref:bpX6 domain-containing protein n=1 Tax=Archangium lipolyticum TaxID=2970465 RepID=UPI00214A5CD9|nr:bpX6 domain-containing protein [Archangium lipolyticum]